MRILASEGKPMDFPTLSDLTGWSLLSLRNLINPMVASGKIRRSKPFGKKGRVMVESV